MQLATKDIPRYCFSSMAVSLCKSMNLLRQKYCYIILQISELNHKKNCGIMYQRSCVSGSGRTEKNFQIPVLKTESLWERFFPVEEVVMTYMEFKKFKKKLQKMLCCLKSFILQISPMIYSGVILCHFKLGQNRYRYSYIYI